MMAENYAAVTHFVRNLVARKPGARLSAIELGGGASTMALFRGGATRVVSLEHDADLVRGMVQHIPAHKPATAEWVVAPYLVYDGEVLTPAWLQNQRFDMAVIAPEHVDVAHKLQCFSDVLLFLDYMGDDAGAKGAGYNLAKVPNSHRAVVAWR